MRTKPLKEGRESHRYQTTLIHDDDDDGDEGEEEESSCFNWLWWDVEEKGTGTL